ncbi:MULTISPECIES: hypothetical protein [Sphingobacterium]|uniref:ABM domain-containing protein n=1 Tax=Sphingobacterium athyrii TaxID=2152717 RepID=A0A363NT17_9SPHI|nr:MULTISPECIES: hypothetical protein [Sphingobacterium]PUV23897.1 hypothetical protein DCO56_10950 [Sphingobacterium athyrii]QIH34335.1 hypothetical protein G6053_16215 [Sphingobacterium sp. DR205]
MAKAYLQVTLKINNSDKGAVSGIFDKFRDSFIDQIKGATSIELLIGDGYIQLLHVFDTVEDAHAFLSTELYNNNILFALKSLMVDTPQVSIYAVL